MDIRILMEGNSLSLPDGGGKSHKRNPISTIRLPAEIRNRYFRTRCYTTEL